jgi:hypothetical protein
MGYVSDGMAWGALDAPIKCLLCTPQLCAVLLDLCTVCLSWDASSDAFSHFGGCQRNVGPRRSRAIRAEHIWWFKHLYTCQHSPFQYAVAVLPSDTFCRTVLQSHGCSLQDIIAMQQTTLKDILDRPGHRSGCICSPSRTAHRHRRKQWHPASRARCCKTTECPCSASSQFHEQYRKMVSSTKPTSCT